MHKKWFLLLLFLATPLAFAAPPAAQQATILDCAVTRVDPHIEAGPLLGLAGMPDLAALIREEHYRFTIPSGGGAGLATTPRENGIPAQVLESKTHFQVDFENKRAIIDRMTAEFQVSFQDEQKPLGRGVCTRLEQRKF